MISLKRSALMCLQRAEIVWSYTRYAQTIFLDTAWKFPRTDVSETALHRSTSDVNQRNICFSTSGVEWAYSTIPLLLTGRHIRSTRKLSRTSIVTYMQNWDVRGL